MLAPDLAEPVAAWRMWNVLDRGDGPGLVSPVRPVAWPHRRAITALCPAGCADPPSRECTCGLYGMTQLCRLRPAARGRARVVGCTALWGRVVEHRAGFRGEFGYPLLLFVLPSADAYDRSLSAAWGEMAGDDLRTLPGPRLAEGLEDRYRIPVRAVSDRDAVHRAWEEHRAQAVRVEASHGLADRRSGDHRAQERLAVAMEGLFGWPG